MFQVLALHQLFYSLRWPINVSTQLLTLNYLLLLALKNGIFPIRGMFTQQIVILVSFLKDFHPMDT